tara:strand:+ start:75 stop:443 length:369 start_codon:yes stop_codon:yes gene_type:complete
MKKAKHKHKIGSVVKFRFFDGSVHIGEIVKHNYMGEDWDHTETNWSIAQYTIHVPSNKYSRGYMIYSSMTNDRIFPKDAKIAKPMFSQSNESLIARHKTKLSSELDDAIGKQKQFISGNVSK